MPRIQKKARPVERPWLPTPTRRHVEAVDNWLATKFDLAREATTAAPFLALLYELEKREMYVPAREHMADHLGVSIYGIDSVLSREMGRGVIAREEFHLIPGEQRQKIVPYDKGQTKGRPHIRKRRKLFLSAELTHLLQSLEITNHEMGVPSRVVSWR